MTITKEQQEALEVLKDFVNSDEYRVHVEESIGRENAKLKAIEQSLQPSQRQYQQAYNL